MTPRFYQHLFRSIRRYLRLPSCRTIVLLIFLYFGITIILQALAIFLIEGPAETCYWDNLSKYKDDEALNYWLPENLRSKKRSVPYNERKTVQLIQDVQQVHREGWRQQVGLHANGSATSPWLNTWVYIGGRPKGSTKEERLRDRLEWRKRCDCDDNECNGFFHTAQRAGDILLRSTWLTSAMNFYVTLPGPSCVDPSETCNAFNDAFDAFAERYHGTGIISVMPDGPSGLGFVDCDVTPALCNEWMVNSVMLANFRSSWPCTTVYYPEVEFSCSSQINWIGLPLRKMPFTRQVRLSTLVSSHALLPRHTAGLVVLDPVVPVFPSAAEQLSVLLEYPGAVDALEVDGAWVTIDKVDVEPDPEVLRRNMMEHLGFKKTWE